MNVVAGAVLFAFCGVAGQWLGEWLCRGRVPFHDGPVPSSAPAWVFAASAAAVGVMADRHGTTTLQLLGAAAFVFTLAAGAAADLRCGIIPDVFTLGPLGAVIVVAVCTRDATPIVGASIVAFPLAVAAVCTRGRGFGWGDVKLGALGGAALGGPGTLYALFGALLCVCLWSFVRRTTAQPVAFAPYFAAAIAAGIGLRTMS